MTTTTHNAEPSRRHLLKGLLDCLTRTLRGKNNETEELFHLINDNIREVVAVVGANGLIRYITPSVKTLLGHEQSTFIGRDVSGTVADVHPEDREHVAELLGRVIRNESASPAVYRSRHADGHYVWLEARATLLKKADGSPNGLLIVSRDVRERVQAEEKLRYHAALLEDVSDAVISIDTQNHIVSWNMAASHIYGWDPAETFGQNLRGLLKTEMTPEQTTESAQRVRETGHWEGNVVQYHKDGTPIHIHSSVSLLRDHAGNPVGMIGINRDITERIDAELALRESEAKFRAITETLSAYIGIVQENRTLYVNPGGAHISGYSVEELKSMAPLQLIHPDYLTLVGTRLAARLRGEDVPANYEIKIVRKDGVERWLLISAAQIMYEGSPAVLISAFDITENKAAEEGRLDLAVEREKVRLLQQLISDLSHDFRHPMTTLNTSLYLLNRAPDAQRREHHMAVMSDQVSHMERILDDLKTVSRLDQEEESFDFQPLNLNTLVKDVVETHLPLATRKGHSLNFSSALTYTQARGDEKSLRQAIANLIINAISYTPIGGEITLQLMKQDRWIGIEVRDNGIGIESDDLRHIFDHFYRADKARSTDTGGVGLGLTIAQRIVKAHGGRITVESTPGEGSYFHLWLPASLPADAST